MAESYSLHSGNCLDYISGFGLSGAELPAWVATGEKGAEFSNAPRGSSRVLKNLSLRVIYRKPRYFIKMSSGKGRGEGIETTKC